MPAVAEEVKTEAGFDSFSSLLVVSMPIWISAYLSYDPAVISLGPIKSSNRIGRQAAQASGFSLEGLITILLSMMSKEPRAKLVLSRLRH
jgi:hypothetical protein